MSVNATYAVFERYAGEKMEPPGPWRDTGIRSDDPEKARAEWASRRPVWHECDVRLAPDVDVGPAVTTPDPCEPVQAGWKIGDRGFWRGSTSALLAAGHPHLHADFDVEVLEAHDGSPTVARKSGTGMTFDPGIEIGRLEPRWNTTLDTSHAAANAATRRRTLDMMKAGVTPIGAPKKWVEPEQEEMYPPPSGEVAGFKVSRQSLYFPTDRKPVAFDNEPMEVGGPGHQPQAVEVTGGKVALSVYLAETERVAERDRIIARLRGVAGLPDTASAETLATHIAKLREACDKSVTIGALQDAVALATERGGVIAFLVGVLDRVVRSGTHEEAQGYAETGRQRMAQLRAGTWKPGPHDDPADWPREWRPYPTEPAPPLTASEALFGFAGWLTTRDEQTIMSARDDARPIAMLVKRFGEENKLTPPREGWSRLLKHPSDTKADSAGLGWVDRGFARASSPVRLTGVLADQTWVAFRSEPDHLVGEAMLRDGRIVTVERDLPGSPWRVRESVAAEPTPAELVPPRPERMSARAGSVIVEESPSGLRIGTVHGNHRPDNVERADIADLYAALGAFIEQARARPGYAAHLEPRATEPAGAGEGAAPMPNANAAIEDAVQHRMTHLASPAPKPVVPVAAMPGFLDRLCRCNMECPLGRTGAMNRCTEAELRAAGVAVQVVEPEPAHAADGAEQTAVVWRLLPADAVVLAGPEAAAYRELQAAALAVEDTHAANQDAQRVHQAKAVTLSRLLAEAARRKDRAP